MFEAFANVVPFQQVSLDAGVAIVGRLVERFGERWSTAVVRFHAFPGAGDRRGRLERTAGVRPEPSKGRDPALARAAIGRGTSPRRSLAHEQQGGDRVPGRVQGIGPWSAGLVLLRGIGRLDVFPPGDVGAARGLRTFEPRTDRRSIASCSDSAPVAAISTSVLSAEACWPEA